MAFHFCPQCGTKLQPGFRFCPSCGEKLPCTDSAEVSSLSHKSTTSSPVCDPKPVVPSSTTGIVSSRPPLRKTRNSLRLDSLSLRDAPSVTCPVKVSSDNSTEEKSRIQASPPSTHTDTLKSDVRREPSEVPPVAKSPKKVWGKAKRKAEEIVEEADVLSLSSPISTQNSKSPSKGKGKCKKTKVSPAVELLQDGTELVDTTGRKWKLVGLLSHTTTELLYEVSPPNAKEPNYIVKVGAKDGKIFNEQNFLQRAAKPASIEKWLKLHKMDFVGLPQCAGFGLHGDSYRFLVFPNMGRTLQSLMSEHNRLLSETTVLQLACHILDILQYLHSNEYVHADINAGNIYVSEGQRAQVYLVGYNYAFRFCPGGDHVEYRQGSRTPHEGAIETISLDSHNGAAPSRRSDLQSLGYCLLYWQTGALPWSTLTQPEQIAAEKRRFISDVPGLLQRCYEKRKVSVAVQSFLSSVMALEYNEQPDYASLKSAVSAGLKALGGSVEQPLRL